MKQLCLFSLLIFVFFACSKESENTATLLISIESTAVDEGNDINTIYLDVNLSRASEDTVFAKVSTINGSAKADIDYQQLTAFDITIEPGETTYSLPIQIIGDEEPESSESFTVKLTSVSNAEIARQTAEVVIRNDDVFSDITDTGYSTPATYPDKTLIWSDEFDADSNISDNWTYETGGHGWGNNELQYYTPNNTFLSDGYLTIEAREELYEGSNYTSARMISANNFSFEYGRVDIRAILPEGQGIWPALWMLGSNFWTVGWPSCGEIDMMEVVGHQPSTTHGTIHWNNQDGQHAYTGGSTTLSSGKFSNEFHVFSIEWTDSSITWYLDDVEFHSIDTTAADMTEFHEKFFFIMNIAVGGNWPGSPNSTTVFPQRMTVDYIRVFQ